MGIFMSRMGLGRTAKMPTGRYSHTQVTPSTKTTDICANAHEKNIHQYVFCAHKNILMYVLWHSENVLMYLF